MSRLLLLLSLIGAAIYAFLIYTHDVLTDEKAEKTYAAQTQPNHPVQHLSSWEPTFRTGPQTKIRNWPPLNHPLLLSKVMSLAKTRSAAQTKLLASENKATSSESGGAEAKAG